MRIAITGANRGMGLGLAQVDAARGDGVWATARKPGGYPSEQSYPDSQTKLKRCIRYIAEG
jgi:NAD(P)-dependent dehydrogenase (short-subunit alcohol dehydrogenase family)